MEILKVEHLTKVYGEGETATRALDDVSFSVEEGEFIAIIGSSGSGKSTLLHLIGLGSIALLLAASFSMVSMSIRAAMKSLRSSVAAKWDSCISSIIWFLFSMWSRI